MSKSFQVPFALITVKPRSVDHPDAKPEPISFLRYATHCWLDDMRAWSDEQGKGSIVKMHRWQKVIERFEAAKQGDWITLDDADYAILKGIVEKPMRFFPSAHATLECLPYSDAVLDAKDELPVTNSVETKSEMPVAEAKPS
jgi:hypothetical protein